MSKKLGIVFLTKRHFNERAFKLFIVLRKYNLNLIDGMT